MSALLIHKGSAESKDSGDRMEEALKRIEGKLGDRVSDCIVRGLAHNVTLALLRARAGAKVLVAALTRL